MPERSIDPLLDQLGSRDPERAWDQFLVEYSPTILQVVRHVEHDSDLVPDCFQFVCEGLSAKGFRRLRQFKTSGPAVFPTWLRAVVRNLCLDWRRKRFGRDRLFKSISRLSAFDQDVFRYLYERRLPLDEVLYSLQSSYAEVTPARIAESRMRIEKELTPKQRLLLDARLSRHTSSGLGETDTVRPDIPDPAPNPEAQALLNERARALQRALAQLPTKERLLIRLRFEQELTLDQVGKLLNLGNAQKVERQVKAVLVRLREFLNE